MSVIGYELKKETLQEKHSSARRAWTCGACHCMMMPFNNCTFIVMPTSATKLANEIPFELSAQTKEPEREYDECCSVTVSQKVLEYFTVRGQKT